MTSNTGPLPSTNLAMIAMIYSRASTVLGSAERTSEWLRTAHPGLDGQTPLAYLDRDDGSAAVLQLLGAIEKGDVA